MKWGPQYWLISFYSNIYGKEKQTKKQFPHEILTQWNSWNVSKAYVTAQRWKSWSRSKEGKYFWELPIFLGMGNIFGDGHYSRGSRHAAVLNLAVSLKSLPCTSRVPTVCPGYRTLTKPVEKHIVREIYVACFICNCLLSCSIISDASASPVFLLETFWSGALNTDSCLWREAVAIIATFLRIAHTLLLCLRVFVISQTYLQCLTSRWRLCR